MKDFEYAVYSFKINATSIFGKYLFERRFQTTSSPVFFPKKIKGKALGTKLDFRSRIFGTFGSKISCLPASPRNFEHVKMV